MQILLTANKGQQPRLTAEVLDHYIEDECEDVDGLFREVIDFLHNANACKKTMAALQKMADQQQAKLEAERKT